MATQQACSKCRGKFFTTEYDYDLYKYLIICIACGEELDKPKELPRAKAR